MELAEAKRAAELNARRQLQRRLREEGKRAAAENHVRQVQKSGDAIDLFTQAAEAAVRVSESQAGTNRGPS